MKKIANTFSELVVLFLVISLSILLLGTEISEKNKKSDFQVNDVNNNETGILPKLESAQVNPEFIKYQKNKILTQIGPSPDGHKTGHIPSPVDLHHLGHISSAKGLSAPVHYDLRDQNRVVTAVKDQGSAGACWAFATYGSLESYLMPGENLDFSENNMKNLLSSAYPEGFDRDANIDGGDMFMSTAYLARWSGPVAESDDHYSDTSAFSSTGFPLQKHVQDVLFLSDRQGPLDNGEIKSALQNYGVVDTSMCWDFDPSYYSPTTYCYYYDGTSDSNHDVAIVGWDDSFDKNKFTKVPPGNGAFIVKNSWGAAPGYLDNGYFYVSYYDSNIGTENAVFTAEDSHNYKSIYQYDPLGWTRPPVGFGNPTGWCANIFTAKSNEILKAVSFYTTDINCKYETYIYTNPGSGPISQASLVLTQKGTIKNAGYHTVHLNSGVQLKAGQKFSVVLKLTTPGYNPIAVESPLSGWSSKAKANAGESFVSPDGKIWTDITRSTNYPNTNVCIKAFTDSGSELPASNFLATPASGNAPLTVLFTDTSTGSTPTSWYWDFGDGTNSKHAQTATHTFTKSGTYTVSLIVKNDAGSNMKSGYITVMAKPTATFTANVTSGVAPLKVQFTSSSTGNPTDYYWVFEPSTSSDWNSHNAVTAGHTFTKSGKYTVSLTVTNVAGSNTVTKQNYITVTAPVKPVASFTANKVSGKHPLTVTFTYTGTGGTPDSYLWKISDGTTSTQAKTATYTFTKAGKYTVSVTVTNSAGISTATKTGHINVS